MGSVIFVKITWSPLLRRRGGLRKRRRRPERSRNASTNNSLKVTQNHTQPLFVCHIKLGLFVLMPTYSCFLILFLSLQQILTPSSNEPFPDLYCWTINISNVINKVSFTFSFSFFLNLPRISCHFLFWTKPFEPSSLTNTHAHFVTRASLCLCVHLSFSGNWVWRRSMVVILA